ncbi:D-amino acid dehydrogenase [Rhodospirillaceae bacterium SYSU D60014]|uniref:D-amino acid dehydrogenase n=1 Tax=Virgifigura deserti TaxID=2268457 RepID=UPI000E6663B8
MKSIVLGGGVIGVTTAYYLAKAGHEVTVIDRQPAVGRETSFANAGLIAPGHAYAWASPRAPKILLQSLYREDTALRFRLTADPRLWAWSLRFLANCTAARNRANTVRKLALCRYSQQVLIALREETGLRYDEVTRGCLYLYRDPAHFETGIRNMAVLKGQGLTLQAIDPERCVEIEPQLRHIKDRLAGAIYAPTDESGDALLFTERLARRCEDLGVTFRLGIRITGLEADGDRIARVVTEAGEVVGDSYVLALGSYSPFLVRPLGIALPVYPIKGYSVTVPIEEQHEAPTVGGVDEGHLVAFARMGDRLRLTGTADFAGYDTSHAPEHFAGLLRVARELFPRGGAYDKPGYWACLRPMTPDGPPILGKARHANLWFNTGHGHMGWTMACGTARITADLIGGRVPEMDLSGLTLERY